MLIADAVVVDENKMYFSLAGVLSVCGFVLVWAIKAIRARDAARDEYRDLVREHREGLAKLEVLWSAQLTRGKVEGERMGHMIFPNGSKNISEDSFKLSMEAWERFQPIKAGLREIGKKMPTASDSSITLVIERKYGRWIVENICRTLGVTDMSCLLMAAHVARSEDGSQQVFLANN